MQREEFETRIRELLPGSSEIALATVTTSTGCRATRSYVSTPSSSRYRVTFPARAGCFPVCPSAEEGTSGSSRLSDILMRTINNL